MVHFAAFVLLPVVILSALLPVPIASLAAETLDDGEAAWEQLIRDHVQSAWKQAQRALDRDPQDPRAACVFVDAGWKEKKQEKATRLLENLAGDDNATGFPHLWRGRWAVRGGRPEEAESLLTRALECYLRQDSPYGAMVAREQLGLLRLDRGRTEEARELLEQALESAERLGKPLAVIFARLQLGRAYLGSRTTEAAVPHLEEVARRSKEKGLHNWEGDAQIGLSIYFRNRMDLDRSLRLRQAALEAYTKAGNLAGQARSRHYIGAIHLMRGELTRALDALHEARDLALKAGDQGEASGCLGDIATVNYMTGNYERAVRQNREALEEGGALRPKHWSAGILTNLGVILTDERRPAEALPYFAQALELVRGAGYATTEVIVLDNLGRCHCELGDIATGIRELEEAERLAKQLHLPVDEAYALRDRGSCLAQAGRLAEAERVLADAELLARRTGYFQVREWVLLLRARLARLQGRRDDADRHLQEAMAVAEDVRLRAAGSGRLQSRFFGRAQGVYEEMVALLAERNALEPGAGHDRRALEVVQKAKARSFLDLLAEAEVTLRSRADSVYLKREADLLDRVGVLLTPSDEEDPARAERIGSFPAGQDDPSSAVGSHTDLEIDRLEEEMDVLEADLRTSDPRYAELAYPRPCALEEVQRSLVRSDEVLLDYFLADSSSYLWVITPTSFSMHSLPGRGRIEEEIRSLEPLLHDGNLLGSDPSYFALSAESLSLWLLGPAMPEITRAEHLVIVPHGILHYLPFEVLLTQKTGSSAHGFESLPYLVRRCDVSYAPSISALARLRGPVGGEGRPRIRDLLLVGDPVASPGQKISAFVSAVAGDAPLPRASLDREVRALQSCFLETARTSLTREAATLSAIRQAGRSGSYRYVHLAAHGILNERRPRYSGLLLSPDPVAGDDGFLTMEETYGLDLECDQVVLSACASGRGEHLTGEGLQGLTRAFLYGGARCVVAALWEVSGEETSAFMERLYRQLKQNDGIDRTRALAETKRWMIRQGGHRGKVPLAHPFFWAPFILTGDGL